METHPDRGGSNEAQARINYAYEILSDPVQRRRHDAALSAGTGHGPVKERYRSKHAEEWEKSFRKNKVKRNLKDRIREEVHKRSEEIRSGYGRTVDAVYADTCGSFEKIRGRCIISAAAACILTAAGFMYPLLWIGAVLSGYAMVRNARYGDSDDSVFVLNPEWKYILKRKARRKVTLESEVLRAHLEDVSERVIQLFKDLRKQSGIKDKEKTVLRRILIHFFMMGYAPVSHDSEDRIITVSNGAETIAVRYRHRAGTPVNTAFIKKFYAYMEENNIQKGFLFAAPGLSGNAAALAEKHGIVHYTISDLNAWISRMTSGHYPGPRGDIIEHVDSLFEFMQSL